MRYGALAQPCSSCANGALGEQSYKWTTKVPRTSVPSPPASAKVVSR
jgi:hypothetical protein